MYLNIKHYNYPSRPPPKQKEIDIITFIILQYHKATIDMILPDDLNGARTEKITGSITSLLKGTKRNHSGVRLIDELMVDIMGGLIPGVLFIFSLIVCFVLPVFIYKYFQPNEYQIAKDAFDNHIIVIGGTAPAIGGWFWFAAFLTFLILSYIAGHIFYRSDTNKADGDDIKRRVRQKSKDIRKTLSKSEDLTFTIKKMLEKELECLQTDVELIPGLNDNDLHSHEFKLLLKHINKAIGDGKATEDLSVLFSILFPHKNNQSCDDNPWNPCSSGNLPNYLSLDEKRIYSYFEGKAKIIILRSKPSFFIRYYFKNRICKSELRDEKADRISLLACYLLLLLQNDSGCSHFDKKFENQSYFPYLDFYKYLLKRNEFDLIQYVDWSPAGARTKNKINRMKIDIQLDYPDAYAIINKNESHIRMASSSWYVSRFVKVMALFSSIAVLVSAFFLYCDATKITTLKNDINLYREVFNIIAKVCAVMLPPSLLALLMRGARHQIAKFIHYQRLREIFFALYIFHKLEEKKQIKSKIIQQMRGLVQLATKDHLIELINGLSEIKDQDGDSELIQRMKAPLSYVWEYLDYGSLDKFDEQDYKSHWRIEFENSPINYLSDCINMLSIHSTCMQDLNIIQSLITFYLELIKSCKN